MSGSLFLEANPAFHYKSAVKTKIFYTTKTASVGRFFAARKSICFYFTGFSLQSGLLETPVLIITVFLQHNFFFIT